MAINKSDSFQPPNWGFERRIPKKIDPNDPLGGWTPPPLPDWPPQAEPRAQTPWPTPVFPGHPWWVDPRGIPSLPYPAPGPSRFPLPPTEGPGFSMDPSQGAPANWLLSYYDQNKSNLESQDSTAPAITGTASGPQVDSRGLLGALYAMAQRASPQPDHGFVSDMQDTPEQELPERRLGRRTYRA
jgi:hypothetical protein